MHNFITPIGEEYPFGGPGKFILGTVQAMAEQLRQEYANTVDLIYIDPPFGTGDGFSVKLPLCRMTLNSISVTNGVPLSKCIGTATSAGNENQIILFSNSAYAKVYIRFCFLIIVIISASSNNDSLNHSLTKHILLLNNSKINTIF